MTILVTGGAGYIGSHTCVELLNEGHEIIVIDNFSNSKSEVLRRVEDITGRSLKVFSINLLEKKELEEVFSNNNIEAVIHFAGYKAVGESVKFPVQYYHNNITCTLILCEMMEKYGVKKMVFSSSATVYGTQVSEPINENVSLNPTSPYGRTKSMIETILHDIYSADNDWSIAILRYFNPIGAHESGRLGEDPNGVPNNIMPYITQVLAGKIDMLNIYGNDYETHDGTGIRDYIHVVDLAKGHLRALEKIKNNPGVEAYNLGTGIGYSVLDLVRQFEKATSTEIPYKFTGRRKGDVAICIADPSKANRELGWRTTKDLEDMCRDSWRWQINNMNGYE